MDESGLHVKSGKRRDLQPTAKRGDTIRNFQIQIQHTLKNWKKVCITIFLFRARLWRNETIVLLLRFTYLNFFIWPLFLNFNQCPAHSEFFSSLYYRNLSYTKSIKKNWQTLKKWTLENVFIVKLYSKQCRQWLLFNWDLCRKEDLLAFVILHVTFDIILQEKT